MQGKVSFLQRSIKDTTNTMVRGKILEAVIEDENPYQADLLTQLAPADQVVDVLVATTGLCLSIELFECFILM